MSVFKYSKYKILIDPKSSKIQGLSVGDVVRRQYVDAKSVIYSLLLVLETGTETITSSSGELQSQSFFIGALLDGDEPQNGQLLDFVRTTNMFNLDRSGALYLTASDSESPYMDTIDGMAVENSMCFPYMSGGTSTTADAKKYAILGESLASGTYTESSPEAKRIFRITKNNVANSSAAYIGLKQTVSK